MYETIPEFLSSVADKYPTKYALYIRRFLRTTRFTYREVEQLSFKIANYLLENNLKPQDKVLIWAPNMPEWVLALFGCLSAGIVVVPVGLHSTAEVVEKYIEQTKPKILFLSKFYPIDFKKSQHKKIRAIFLEELGGLVENTEPKKLPHISKSELAEIVFTSGTTGKPKGVMISHHNILYEIEQLLKTVPKYKHYRLLSVLPLSHVMEQVVGLMTPLARGGTIYYLPRINIVTIKKALQKYHITDLGLVPQMLRMFLDTIEYQVTEQKEEWLFNISLKFASVLPLFLRTLLFPKIHESLGGKLYVFGVGSAPLDVKLAQAWEAMGIKVVEGYGASEMTGGVTANRIDDRKLGSVGKKIPGMDIKLSSEGEILVKAENVTKGYFENEQKTKESFTSDGYFKSGDVGYFKDEYLYISGREKFKIITAAGDKIYPEDIERKLNTHPDVWDSCVFGIKKGDGEIVYATVILKGKAKQKLDSIIKNVNKNLEANQQIMDFSLWPEKDFPRLHTLKVDRNQVKQLLTSGKEIKSVSMATVGNKDRLKRIVAIVCKVNTKDITETTKLVTDLKLDSLKRVELVSLIEEEYGSEIEEEKITPETTLRELENLLDYHKKQKEYYDLEKVKSFLLNPISRKIKVVIQNLLLLLLLKPVIKIKVESEISLNEIKSPVVFIGNHFGPHDVTCFMTSLPSHLREKIMAPSTDYMWRQSTFRIVNDGFWMMLLGGFPLSKFGGEVKRQLDFMVDLLEDGYSLLVMPEGRFTPLNEKLAEFKGGMSLILSGTDIPVIPFHISGSLHDSFPPNYEKEGNLPQFLFPKGHSEVLVKIGQPFTLKTAGSDDAAIKIMREKILELAK